MATADKNLSDHFREDLPEEFKKIPSGQDYRFGIVVSEWNYDITGSLLKGAQETLLQYGVPKQDIIIQHVPGTFELALGAKLLIENENLDGVIAIGSVIQGETKHFDFVCEAAAQGIKDVSLETKKPVIFCVLTDNTKQQALDRSGGKYGNKGIECAIACLKMVARFSL